MVCVEPSSDCILRHCFLVGFAGDSAARMRHFLCLPAMHVVDHAPAVGQHSEEGVGVGAGEEVPGRGHGSLGAGECVFDRCVEEASGSRRVAQALTAPPF